MAARIYAFICLWAFVGSLNAQCDRIGWVASILPGCGAVIVDQSTSESLQVVAGADQLTGGKFVRFSSIPAAPSPVCPTPAYPTIALTCINDTLPCQAKFDYAPNDDQALSFAFEAFVFDENLQHCAWDFGDGSNLVKGGSTTHVFTKPGVYEVCLWVKDDWGCSAQQCRKVVAGIAQPTCDYDMTVTSVGKTLYAKLSSKNAAPGEILNVQWHASKMNDLLGKTPSIVYPMPHYGKYIVCADYEVRQPDGAICAATDCKLLAVAESECINPSLAKPGLCATQDAPVCSCEGITYPNECEAMVAGVSTWWTGSCDKIHGACFAEMEAATLQFNPATGFTTRFSNLSTGSYVFAQLDFGDGTPMWKGTKLDSVISHDYAVGGIYRANLTVWSLDGCESSVTKLIVTDALHLAEGVLPGGTDYVFPGDADGDKKANVYDLLNIGVGHDVVGVPRPYAHTAWAPQFAPNWSDAVAGKVNFKHLDCDGDGEVDDYDADVIPQHYQAIDAVETGWVPNAPRIWLDLKAPDTIYVDETLPATLQIKADVMVGSPTEPALNLYGLAFTLQYPEFVNHDPEADYSTTSIFGDKHYLWLPHDVYSKRQLDMGLVKTNHASVSGYSKIAEVTFQWDYVIIIDVIGREQKQIVPFAVSINGVRAIDSNGNIKTFSVPTRLDTVWIKKAGISSTNHPNLSARCHLYPNPATEETLLYTGDLQVERLEALNAIGQVVQSFSPSGKSVQHLQVSAWKPGVYTLRIQTKEGVAEKRLVVD